MTPERAWMIANHILDQQPHLAKRWLMKNAMSDSGVSLNGQRVHRNIG